MKRILIVFGTRPEAIKMAPLVKELQKNPDQFETIVCVTGQHREMLDQVLHVFEIVPDYDLNLMKPGQDLYDVTAGVLLGMRDIIKNSNPDIVLVHGDTSTSTSSALAAYYQHIPVGHVEAGLRTYNIYSPWPEELNRQITSRIATYHFAPTSLSKKNLVEERISENKILITGNTVIDALFMVLEKINTTPEIECEIHNALIKSGLPLIIIEIFEHIKKGSSYQKKIILITGHRRENFGDGFINICNALKMLSDTFSDVIFIYPMHLNPNVRKPIEEIFNISVKERQNIFFIEPLEYLPFVYLMSKSYLILTDSGGIQEEAPSLGKPVLVMRNNSERPEAINAGTVKLVGTDFNRIVEETTRLLLDKKHYESMANANNPYGDGRASRRIVTFLKDIE